MIIKIVTLSLMAVFYICYFAKLISQKKQGIKTDQLGKGKEGFVKFIEVALKIITYLLPVIQIISIVFCSGTAHIVLQFTGVVITMFGVLAFIVSVTQMKENWRAGVQKEEKTNLVTTGIYSISRNPAFLGFDLMYIGILFSFFNWFLCFATGFAVVFFHLQIVNVEEDFLIKAFGNEYLQYKSKVCRYLGRKRQIPVCRADRHLKNHTKTREQPWYFILQEPATAGIWRGALPKGWICRFTT